MMNLGQAPNGREILWRQLQNVLEFLPGILKPSHFDECAAKRDVGGEIRGMTHQTGLAGFNGFLVAFSAPIFLGESRKRNGRRVRLDPAFQFLDARRIRHG